MTSDSDGALYVEPNLYFTREKEKGLGPIPYFNFQDVGCEGEDTCSSDWRILKKIEKLKKN